VYTFDFRGFGETVRPAEPKLSHELWIDDISRFLEHFDLNQIFLAGHSMGGRMATRFTIENPSIVRQLVLIGAPSPLQPPTARSGFNERQRLIDSGAKPAEIVAATFEFTKKAFS